MKEIHFYITCDFWFSLIPLLYRQLCKKCTERGEKRKLSKITCKDRKWSKTVPTGDENDSEKVKKKSLINEEWQERSFMW